MNDGDGRATVLARIRLAASFLTILPVAEERTRAPADVAASFGWFPLIGFAIGGALAIEYYLLGFIWARLLRSALVVMTLVIVTGGLHLDGLADTCDALGAGRNRARALEILRDSRIGTFGACGLFFVLALKIFAIARYGGWSPYAALWIAPALARWAMVSLAHRLDYLRSEGAGTTLLAHDDRRGFVLASIIVVIGALPILGGHALRAFIVAVALTWALGAFYRRWLGGVTGDLIGAAGEVIETAVLIAMCV
jgi:adenosylcobinamide-GDP ribazoletransferase